ncbi:oxygenase MpaB family protein [Nocardioides sp. AE5]|uniref:oxygenase MpaB family protein n=1 Tax=Nocardioides sp. AE5 TaxID=2962573 RepID=UPI0028823E03|nr:oxygenase MpaB family protein [Nocardioides sp. AE5]MDT0200663.1 oxygenase MpaB family protein [Nocardioides sp. AE5]
MAIALKQGKAVEPHEDHGFFGPDSVTWKVWSYPTSLTVGFQRAVVIEELDPALVAAVETTNDVRYRPRTRYDRTLRYFAMVAFGDTRSTSKAADVLVRIHSKAIGTDPVTGIRYDANDPDSQLWIHLTAWHSILKAYEMFGPGKLSAADEAQYWRECKIAAELQTCDQADIPTSREELHAYYEKMRPQLLGSKIATDMMAHLLDARVMLPPVPKVLTPASWAVGRLLRAATISTMPRWMREMGGCRQSRLVDIAVRPIMRVAFWSAQVHPRIELALLGYLSPATVPVVAPILLGIEPSNPETLTPAQARERYGYQRPREAHLEFRARQAERVFGNGGRPSDEGLLESQEILGPVS